MAEFGVSRRTVARDLDFLRDEERAPLTYDDVRHGFRLQSIVTLQVHASIVARGCFSSMGRVFPTSHFENRTPVNKGRNEDRIPNNS